MKKLRLAEAMKLVAARTSPAVSIYVGTDVQGKDSQKTISEKLHRLYRSVEATITKRFGEFSSLSLLYGLKQALRNIRPKRARGGIAIYHSEGFTGVLHLPTPVSDLAVAADSFHLKPVLIANQIRRSFYLLLFSNKEARFYKVTADKMTELERTKYFTYRQPFFDDPPAAGFKTGSFSDMDSWTSNLKRKIDLHCSMERLPLLLAGSSYHQNAFRSSFRYPFVVEGEMTGDFSQLSQQKLFNKSSLFMENYFSMYQERAIQLFEEAEQRGQTSNRIEIVAKAAAQGNVQHLFIAEDRHLWGHLDRDSGDITLQRSHEQQCYDDILDDLAELTLQMKGEVTVLPSVLMPDGKPIGAIFKRTPNVKAMAKKLHSYRPSSSITPAGHLLSLSR